MSKNRNENVKRHRKRKRIVIKTKKPSFVPQLDQNFDLVEESIEIIIQTEYIIVNKVDNSMNCSKPIVNKSQPRKSTVLNDLNIIENTNLKV